MAESLATELREIASAVPADRIHLHAVARALSVGSVRVMPLGVDGQVTWADGPPAIIIREDMSETRKRFTLAHELAHVALGHGGVNHRCNSREQDERERLCDAVAAALLMPASYVENWLQHHELTLDAHVELASQLVVSRAALARRITELTGTTCILATFTRGRDHWRAGEEVYGRTPHGSPDRRPRLSHQANLALEDASVDEAAMQLLLRFGSRAYRCDATVALRGRQTSRGAERRAEALVTHLTRTRDFDAR